MATCRLPGLDKAAIIHITAIEAAGLPACRDLAAKVAIGPCLAIKLQDVPLSRLLACPGAMGLACDLLK